MNVIPFRIGIIVFLDIIVHAEISLVAKFDLGGIKGDVTFTQTTVGSPVTYTFKLNGISEPHDWAIHQFRVNYDTLDRCATANVGERYGNLTKNIVNGTETGSFNDADLCGARSIQGRSLVLKRKSDDTIVSCGTIESSGDYKTVTARLRSTIAGDVIFRQTVGSGGCQEVTVYADLFHVDGNSAPIKLEWFIYDGRVEGDLTESVDVATRCTKIGEMFNPTSATSQSCTADHARCAVGNLNGKLGEISIGVTKGEARQLFHDANLHLSGSQSIIDKTLLVRSSDKSTLSCGNIVEIKERQTAAKFSSDGVKGEFTITQRSPFDYASITVAFHGLNSMASGYHIHQWPVPRRVEKDDLLCNGTAVSGHFNPFNVNVTSSPSPKTGTPDQYEVGDISGKFGTLDGEDNHSATYIDSNIQLFGVNSVIGRSLVIHKGDGSRWVCANIIYLGTLKISQVTFNYPVIGHIQFQQPQDFIYSETSIYVDLNYGDRNTTTSNHDWHIHVNKIGGDFDASDSRCQSVSGHFNPYSVDLEGDYQTECNSANPLRCELGDLSSKNGQLTIRNGNAGAKNFFSDNNLPLTGPQSITRRSVVIHGADSAAARLSCANIYEVPTRVAEVSTWTSPVTGKIIFEENFGLVTSNVKMIVDLKNLGGLAKGYHVHEYPVTIGNCLSADVGGHLDPFGVGTNANIGVETNDKYEIGDLSAKFETLASKDTYSTTREDNNLPLRGLHSVVGRSIVIHKESQNARWSCGNITEDITKTKGKLLRARAVFSEGNIRGYVEMEQYIYPDGGLSDTGILLDLGYNDGSPNTADHNWHIHSYPIRGDATASTGRCQSAGGHYNPFHSNLNVGYDECSPKNPLRCELGDLSNKLAKYEIGSGKKFYSDVNLPLAGPFTVLGRSVVFHVKNAGAARLACADILPADTYITYSYKNSMGSLNSTYVTEVLSKAINTDSSNIRVVEMTDDTENNCKRINIYFVGETNDLLYVRFSDLLKSGNTKALKELTPCKDSSMIVNVSMLVLLFATAVSRWLI